MQKTSVFSSGQDGATLEGADGPVPDNISPQILFGRGAARGNDSSRATTDCAVINKEVDTRTQTRRQTEKSHTKTRSAPKYL